MLVVSYLPPLLLPRLVDADRDVGADHIRAPTWEAVADTLRQRHVGVMVLDPYADQTSRAHEVAKLLLHFPSTPVIAYTQFIPAALRALSLLARRGLHETVLFQFDDGRGRLARLLVRASTRSLVVQFLSALQKERNQLAPSVTDALDDMFTRPHAYTSARDLVVTSGTPLTTLYRAFTEAGLASPKQVFVAARVLHAAAYLRDPGYTIQEVADKTGYHHPRVLTQHTLAVFRMRPSALREVPEADVITALVAWAKRENCSPL